MKKFGLIIYGIILYLSCNSQNNNYLSCVLNDDIILKTHNIVQDKRQVIDIFDYSLTADCFKMIFYPKCCCYGHTYGKIKANINLYIINDEDKFLYSKCLDFIKKKQTKILKDEHYIVKDNDYILKTSFMLVNKDTILFIDDINLGKPFFVVSIIWFNSKFYLLDKEKSKCHCLSSGCDFRNELQQLFYYDEITLLIEGEEINLMKNNKYQITYGEFYEKYILPPIPHEE